MTRIDGPTGDMDVMDEIDAAIAVIRKEQRASSSVIQRHLRIRYVRACRIMDVLEERGLIGPMRGSEPREILMDSNTTDQARGISTSPGAAGSRED